MLKNFVSVFSEIEIKHSFFLPDEYFGRIFQQIILGLLLQLAQKFHGDFLHRVA